MPDPDFSVNDVRLCVGKCPGALAHPYCDLGRYGGMGRVIRFIKAWFCSPPIVQLLEPELSLASKSQLLPA